MNMGYVDLLVVFDNEEFYLPLIFLSLDLAVSFEVSLVGLGEEKKRCVSVCGEVEPNFTLTVPIISVEVAF